MGYRVILTPRALADADAATGYVRQFGPDRAARWFTGLTRAVLSLDEMPHRCGTAPEAAKLGVDLRQLLYGRRTSVYRVIFRIYEHEPGEGIVRVVAIRHGARDQLSNFELHDAVTDDLL